jgi:putative toxin-antitoxin system antitoxin component (TIGR02293 family)
MTMKEKSPKDIALLEWADIAPSDLKSVFRRKSQWVIDSPKSRAVWYSTVISNLQCHYILTTPSSIDVVRDTLHAGLSREAFDRLRSVTNMSTKDLSRAIGVSSRTLARRERFKQDESGRLLRVASVFQKALEVFADIEKARRWFKSPKRALGSKSPVEFCDTEPGAEEVTHLLGRIEHGVFC